LLKNFLHYKISMPKKPPQVIDAIFSHVANQPFSKLKKIQAQTGISLKELQTAIKRKTGCTFTQWQMNQRIDFVVKNQRLTNIELMQAMGIPSTETMSRIMHEAKRRGLLVGSRLAQKSANRDRLQNHPSALSVMRLLKWLPIQEGIGYNHISHIMKLSTRQIWETLDLLKQNGLIEQHWIMKPKRVLRVWQGQKQSFVRDLKNTFFFITPAGRKWLNEMEVIRVQRDGRLEKTRFFKPLLNRKENELDFYENVLAFSNRLELIENSGALEKVINHKKNEIEKLRLLIYGKTQ
jgi:AraC-like DNA-binding protein/DNA-binding PadR family transcriptional regulator